MATFKVTLVIRDKWADLDDGEGSLALTKEELLKQVDKGSIDFAGLEVLEQTVEEITE